VEELEASQEVRPVWADSTMDRLVTAFPDGEKTLQTNPRMAIVRER
jgi:hypothetical protein